MHIDSMETVEQPIYSPGLIKVVLCACLEPQEVHLLRRYQQDLLCSTCATSINAACHD